MDGRVGVKGHVHLLSLRVSSPLLDALEAHRGRVSADLGQDLTTSVVARRLLEQQLVEHGTLK